MAVAKQVKAVFRGKCPVYNKTMISRSFFDSLVLQFLAKNYKAIRNETLM